MNLTTVKAALLCMLSLALTALPASLRAEDSPAQLFRVITAKDDVILGGFKKGEDVETLAMQLTKAGYLTGWHYVIARSPEGSLIYKPRQIIAVFANGVIRIEPMSPEHPVVAP